VLAILAGVGWFLLGLLSLVVPYSDLRSATMGFAVDGLVGAAFVWAGVGSLRRRRWARSIMLILAWTWLLGGAFALVLVPGLIDGVLPPSSAGIATVVRLVAVGIVGFGGVLLPAVFVWAYRDPDVQRTCERDDPTPAWTERCPTPVLGLSVALAALAALALPMLARPVVPLFGLILVGWAGALVLVAGALASAWLARECYRLTASGWWGSTILLAAVGASTAMTLLRVDPLELYRRMGYTAQQAELLGGAASGPLLAWITALLTLLSVGYMVVIYRHFRPRRRVA
jgi:hypothetical protein